MGFAIGVNHRYGDIGAYDNGPNEENLSTFELFLFRLMHPSTSDNFTYNGSNQLTGFQADGLQYTISYPNATTIIIAGPAVTKTVTLDGSQRVTSITTS